ncbi:MAG: peptidylprolyl isomerase [Nitrospinales bacterium]
MRQLNFKFTWAFPAILAAWLIYAPNVEAHGGGHDHDANDPTISLPDAVARVNGVDIPGQYVWRQLKQIILQRKAQGKRLSPDQEKAEAKKLTEQEIERELLLQRGKELGLQASPEQTEQRFNKIKASFKSDHEFQDKLAEEKMTPDELRKEVEMDLLMEAVLKKEIEPRIEITPEELKAYYEKNKNQFATGEQTRASVILIKIDPKGGPKAAEKANEKIEAIRNEIKDGEDFAEAARKYSQDSLAKRGGDLGFFTRKIMFAPFSQRAFKMKVGEISEVFRTQHGYQLLKVTGKKPGEISPFEKVKKRIEAIVKREKSTAKTREFVNALRQKAEVQVYF